MSKIDPPVMNEDGVVFSNAKALQDWEAWAKARVEEGLVSPTISHEEARKRIEDAIKNAQRKMV